MVNCNELETGDLLLFESTPKKYNYFFLFDYLIKKFTNSKFTHCAVVLKNPKFFNKNLDDGIYIWESGIEPTNDVEDNKKKFGVQITKFDDYIKYWGSETKFYTRQWKINKTLKDKIFSDINLKILNACVYDKPYDINPFDWVEGLLQLN